MAVSSNTVDPVKLVCCGNVENTHFDGISGIKIYLDLTKTIQNGERRQVIPLAINNEVPLLCPVRAIATLRSIVGEENITADTSLFQTRDFSAL